MLGGARGALGGGPDVGRELLGGGLSVVCRLLALLARLTAHRRDVLGQLGGFTGEFGLRGLKASHLAFAHLLGDLVPLGEELLGPLADVLLFGRQSAGRLHLLRTRLLTASLLS